MSVILEKSKTILTREEISILFKSESTKAHQGLLQLLSKFVQRKKTIKLKDIHNLYNSDFNLYSILVQGKKALLEETMKEWSYAGYYESNNKQCQLCGNKQLKDNYRIINKINGNVMLIGSQCRNKFDRFKPDSDTLKKEKREISKVKKIRLINEIYKDYVQKNNLLSVEELLDTYKIFYRDFPIILPISIDKKLVDLLKNSEKFYEDFIHGRMKDKEASKLGNLILEFENVKIKAQDFYNKHCNNLFLCDSNITRWIESNCKNYNDIKRSIKMNGGIINRYIAQSIYCFDFIKKFENKISIYFEKNGFKLTNIDRESITVCYKTIEGFDVDLIISHKTFVKNFSQVLFEDINSSDANKIISKFDIVWEEDNLERYFFTINNYRIENTPYRIYILEKKGRLMKGIRVEKKEKYFIDIYDKNFINLLKSYVNKDENVTKENIVTYFNGKNNWEYIKNKEQESRKIEMLMRA